MTPHAPVVDTNSATAAEGDPANSRGQLRFARPSRTNSRGQLRFANEFAWAASLREAFSPGFAILAKAFANEFEFASVARAATSLIPHWRNCDEVRQGRAQASLPERC